MTKPEILAELRRLNPKARDTLLHLWADAFLEYRKAQANIEEHGSICFHPRTGAPIENFYIPIRDRAARSLSRMKLKTGELWEQYEPERIEEKV